MRGKVFALALLAPLAAHAETPEQTADRLFKEALALVAEGKYADACPKLEKSQSLDPALGTQFNLADCYEHTGRKASARRVFGEVAKAAKAAGKNEREKSARERAAALDASVALLTVAVPAEGSITVTLDGAPLPRASYDQPEPVDAGPHTVAASAPGKKSFEAKVVLEDAKRATVRVPELEDLPASSAPAAPAPAPDGAGQRRAAFIVGGVGAAGLVVGAVAGLFSISKHDTAKKTCPDNNACPDAQARSDWDAATTAGNVSTVGFVVGGVGLAAAAVLFFTAPSPRVTASARGVSIAFY